MFLDINIKDKLKVVEFKLERVVDLSAHEREWLLVSNGETEKSFNLKFSEESYILKNIINIPKGLKTDKDAFTYLINEFLKLEHEKRQEGFDSSDDNSNSSEIQPYDPKKISIRNERWSLSHVYELMEKYQYIDLNPDFQRNFVWDIRRRSRLIESLMLRIPIPAFYLAETETGKYQVVDGLQRLTTIRDFFKNDFYLKGLEYLIEQEGRFFKEAKDKEGIDQEFEIAINLTQINVNIIESKSPAKVKFDVFRRVNTGGQPLNNQEIRNCLAEKTTRDLIKELAYSEEFKNATGGSVKTTRMQAQELVLRFIAFYHERIIKSSNWQYKGNMTEYLDDSIELLNTNKGFDFIRLKKDFFNAMSNCYYLFGEYSFRKCLPMDLKQGARRRLINKSLFTTWSVLLSRFSNKDIKNKIKAGILAPNLAKKLEENKKYFESVSYKTNDKNSLEFAFKETQKIIDDHIVHKL